METKPVIRQATVADAAALARLHVAAWQWAYRGLLPDAYLDGLSDTVQRREEWRRSTLGQAHAEAHTWVAEVDQAVLGFADTGPTRDEDVPPGTAELYTLYLEPRVVGTGLGREMLGYATADLRERGFATAVLWVLANNARARRFYEIAGWRTDGVTKTVERPGVELREVRYRVALTAP